MVQVRRDVLIVALEVVASQFLRSVAGTVAVRGSETEFVEEGLVYEQFVAIPQFGSDT